MSDWNALKTKRMLGKAEASSTITTVDSAPLPAKVDDSAPPTTLQSRLPIPHFVDLPPNIEIVEIEGKGRCMFAKSLIHPGDTLISTQPFVSVLDDFNMSVRCSRCFRPEISQGEANHIVVLSKCAACHAIKYCSKDCQTSDWKIHRLECKALQKYDTAKASSTSPYPFPNEMIRGQARLIWGATHGGEEYWNVVNSMNSNRLTCSTLYKEAAFRISVHLASYIGHDLLTETFPTSTELLDFCCRFSSNSFSLSDPFMSSIGTAVSPLLALLNHSCEPNTNFVFPMYPSASNRKSMRLIAMKTIRPGDEITTSYVMTSWNGSRRRSQLRSVYQFECHCRACVAGQIPGSLDIREALVCVDTNCDGLVPMPKIGQDTGVVQRECGTCHKQRSIDVGKHTAALQTALDSLKGARATQDPKLRMLHISKTLATLQAHSFARTSDPFYALLIDFSSAAMVEPTVIDKMQIARASVDASLRLHTPGHPVITLSRLLLTKLASAMVPTHLAKDTSREDRQRVLDIVRTLRGDLEVVLSMAETTFGRSDSVVVANVRSSIENMDQEIAIRAMDLRR